MSVQCHSVHVEVRGQGAQLRHFLCRVDPRGELRLSGLVQVPWLDDSPLQPPAHLAPATSCLCAWCSFNMLFMDVGRYKSLHCSFFIVTEAEKLRYCSLANELALGIPSLCPPAGIRGMSLRPTWVLKIGNLVLVLERHVSLLQPCSFLKLCNRCASEGLLSSSCLLSHLFFLFGLLLLFDICSEFW